MHTAANGIIVDPVSFFAQDSNKNSTTAIQDLQAEIKTAVLSR